MMVKQRGFGERVGARPGYGRDRVIVSARSAREVREATHGWRVRVAAVRGRGARAQAWRRVGFVGAVVTRFTVVRLVALFFTVVIGVYLTILIANMGGHVDDIRRAQIREMIDLAAARIPALRQLSVGGTHRFIDERVALAEKRIGLDQPFLIRSFRSLSGTR